MTTAGLLWPLEDTLPGHWGPLSKGLADPHGLRDSWCDAEPRDKEHPPQAWQRPRGPPSPGWHPEALVMTRPVYAGASPEVCASGGPCQPLTPGTQPPKQPTPT